MRQSTLDDHNSTDEYPCPWDGCDEVFDTQRGRSGHHVRVHGESLTRTTRECPVCGDEFTFYSSTLDQRTCSRECDAKLRQEWVTLTCENCGDEYRVKPARESYSRYCSHDCYWNDNRLTRVCENCGETFTRRASEFENPEQAFCSHPCFNEWRGLGVRIGDSNTVYRAVRDYLLGGDWGTFAAQKRGEKCEVCGSTENLELHHIVPLLYGGTHGDWNLMTACRECHHGKLEFATKEYVGRSMLEVGYG